MLTPITELGKTRETDDCWNLDLAVRGLEEITFIQFDLAITNNMGNVGTDYTGLQQASLGEQLPWASLTTAPSNWI